MNCFVVFDGHKTSQLVEKARLADNVELVRILSRRLEDGAQLFKRWAESHGTNAVEMAGSRGAVEIPADYLSELGNLKDKYEQTIENQTSLGVGMKLSEAEIALEYSQKVGGNRVVFYTDEIKQALDKIKEAEENADGEILGKSVAANQGAHAGFNGMQAPMRHAIDKPTQTQGEHSSAQDVLDVINEERPAAPEVTHAADGLEDQFHKFAEQSEQDELQGDQIKAQRLNEVKGQVVEALQALKAQAPILEQLKGQVPEVYGAMQKLSAAVINFARELAPSPSPMQKSEAPPSQGMGLVHYSRQPGLKFIDTNHMGTGAPSAEYKQGLPAVPRAYYYAEGSVPEPIVTQGAKAVYRASLGPEHKIYDLGEDPEELGPAARQAFLEGRGKGHSPQDTLLHEVKARGYYGYRNSRSSQPHTVALFYDHPVEEMNKMALPMPETTHAHHRTFPPGSILGNKIKVQHSDGTESWKQVSAGMVRSQDPSGHPVSSRNPNSR